MLRGGRGKHLAGGKGIKDLRGGEEGKRSYGDCQWHNGRAGLWRPEPEALNYMIDNMRKRGKT